MPTVIDFLINASGGNGNKKKQLIRRFISTNAGTDSDVLWSFAKIWSKMSKFQPSIIPLLFMQPLLFYMFCIWFDVLNKVRKTIFSVQSEMANIMLFRKRKSLRALITEANPEISTDRWHEMECTVRFWTRIALAHDLGKVTVTARKLQTNQIARATLLSNMKQLARSRPFVYRFRL